MTSPALAHKDHLIDILNHAQFSEPAQLARFLVVRAGWSKPKVVEVFGMTRYQVDQAIEQAEVVVESDVVVEPVQRLTPQELACMVRDLSASPYATVGERAEVLAWIKATVQSQRCQIPRVPRTQSESWEYWG